MQRNKSFLNAYLENPALDIKDVVGMACDMLLAGIDTVNITKSYNIFNYTFNIFRNDLKSIYTCTAVNTIFR